MCNCYDETYARKITAKESEIQALAAGIEAGIKRNKQVDVPTEQWQKSIERDINEIRTTILKQQKHSLTQLEKMIDDLDHLPECHTNSVNMIRRIEKRLDKIEAETAITQSDGFVQFVKAFNLDK